jgi:DNA-directed RNA polymerase beta subunit
MVEVSGGEPSMLVPEYTEGIPDVPGIYANTAFMLYNGWNLEDAAVISKSASEKLSTKVIINEKASTPYDITPLVTIGDNVRKGTPLAKWEEESSESTRFLHAGVSIPGCIKNIEIFKSLEGVNIINNIKVTIDCTYRCTVGSKVSNMHSSKSIISRIIPDDEMPHCNGVPTDIIISPYSIARRMAPSCIMEVMLNTYISQLRKLLDNNEIKLVVAPFDKSINFLAVASNLEQMNIPGDCMYYLTSGVNGKEYPNKTLFGPMRLGRLHHHSPDKMKSRGEIAMNHNNIAMRGMGNQRYGREEIEVFMEYGARGMIKEIKHHQQNTGVVDRIFDLMSCIGYEIQD